MPTVDPAPSGEPQRNAPRRHPAGRATDGSAALLLSFLDTTPDGIIAIDEDGIVSIANRSARRMFGRTDAEFVGCNVSALMPEPYRSEYDAYFANHLQTAEARLLGLGREAQGLRSDGGIFPMSLRVTEFSFHGRRQFALIVRDISDRRTLEAQLIQSQKMEAFGQLAGGVAHDFNNLLTVILGYSELLLPTLADDDARRAMVVGIREAGEQGASLTRQLLAFSRQQIVAPRVLDLNIRVSVVESMLRRLIGEDVQLITNLSPAISAVRADPAQIEQIILNLAVNSRDAMPTGGVITIETRDVELDEAYTSGHPGTAPGRFVMLALSDTGGGMPPEVRAHLFEPFFTTKAVGIGTGLGLAVVQGIVNQSGGIIDVESEIGTGTRFRVYIPAVEEQPAELPGAALEVPARGFEVVIVVEDDDRVRNVTTTILRDFGYTVLAAAGGNAALKLIASHPEPIDLLLTDVVLRGMNGRELAELVLQDHPEMKVLYASGYTDDAVVRRGVLRAEVAFLPKPFTPIALAAKVRSVLDPSS